MTLKLERVAGPSSVVKIKADKASKNLCLTAGKQGPAGIQGIQGEPGDGAASSPEDLIYVDSPDIGEALADDDEFPVSNTSSGSSVVSALSRVWTYVLSKMPFASQAEMEAGTETSTRSMSPERVKQAIDALGGGGGGGGDLVDDLTPQLGGDLDTNDFGFVSSVADGASAVAFEFDTANPLATSGVKLLEFRNNGVDKLSVSIGGSIDLLDTVDSDSGVVTKGGSRFIHNFAAGGTNGGNTFVGDGSGNFTLTGSDSGSEGSYNVGLGVETLKALTTGYWNVMLGGRAGWKISSGIGNIGIGYGALWNVTTGNSNVGVGFTALASLTTANYAASFGTGALANLTTGVENTAVGYYAGGHVGEGRWNTAIGAFALGETAGSSLNTHAGNTSIGRYTLNKLTAGDFNTALGMNSGSLLVDGDRNTFIGMSSGFYYTTGDENTILGSYAGTNGTTGSGNTIVGEGAAISLTTGSSNLVLGNNADVASATGDYQLNIGDVFTGSVAGGTEGFSLESQVADGASAVAFSLDTANALATSGAKLLSLSNNGVVKAEVTKDGALGVGIANPLAQLDVRLSGDTKGPVAYFGNETGGRFGVFGVSVANSFYIGGSSLGENITIKGGDVGINFSNPSAKLHIHASVVNNEVLIVSGMSGQTGDVVKVLNNGSNWVHRITSGGQAAFGNINALTISSAMHIKGFGSTSSTYALKTEDSSGTLLFSVRDDGNVGIGTASPDSLLDVNGAITQHELSADPADPAEGASVTWQSDGTGSGDDGDIMMKITAGGTTKTVTLVDFSAA